MAEANTNLLHDVVMAHRILVNQDVLDAFGHVSFRDPIDDNAFWLASAVPPSTVSVADIMAFGLDGAPLAPTEAPLYAERFIHSEIYAARPDVQSICHHHALAIMPFCIGQSVPVAVTQTGGFLGDKVPMWDSADEFGDTNMLIKTPEEAASLARALGQHSVVLMRGHGATVVGNSIRDLVFRAVYSSHEAEIQRAAAAWGPIKGLSAGEIAMVGDPATLAVERCWTHWTASLPPISEIDNEGLTG